MLAAGVLTLGGVSPIRRALGNARAPVQGINDFKGKVLVNGVPATIGLTVAAGDVVTTGQDSRGIIVIGENGFLIHDNAEVRFSGKDAAIDFFRVVSGKILSVMGPGKVAIDTPVATIGIRGTGFFINAGLPVTYVCICYGKADLVPKADPGAAETVTTTRHDQPRFISDGREQEIIEVASVIDHTDAELVMLEGLFGRDVPFDPTIGYSDSR